LSLPCSIGELIPQKGKMGFDQTLIQAKLDKSESTATIGENNVFLDDHHQLSNSALIEYINQLTAAALGYNGRQSHQAIHQGLFVGLQDAQFFDRVYSGDVLTLKGYLTEEVSQVSFIQGIIERDGEKIAELVTKLYQVKDSIEFESLTSHGEVHVDKSNLEFGQEQEQAPDYLVFAMHRKLFSYIHDSHIGDSQVSFNIACPQDFDAFDGHFPGNFLLPGVILLEIASVGLELFMQKAISLCFIKRMKISGVILPAQVISCNIKVDRLSGTSETSFSALFQDQNGKEISRFSGYGMPANVGKREANNESSQK
jgi:3-hydroxymyristoyl/3-hydroxydecanoyl-(acyl carrier protein) dehydratase